jgi:hypothetical protein
MYPVGTRCNSDSGFVPKIPSGSSRHSIERTDEPTLHVKDGQCTPCAPPPPHVIHTRSTATLGSIDSDGELGAAMSSIPAGFDSIRVEQHSR